MIEIHFTNGSSCVTQKWFQLGLFYSTSEALTEVKTRMEKSHNIVLLDEFNSLGTPKGKNYIKFQFKFFDTELNDYVSIESPWKVGLK